MEVSKRKSKSIFERMPSPSGFGHTSSDENGAAGRDKVKALLDEIPIHLRRKPVEGNNATPYADFT